jgi:DNA-binding transcriptional LysR family regulator
MDKIHAMQLFVRVAELESFSRAAETLTLPKSVSRQIQALENRLAPSCCTAPRAASA